MLFAGGDGDAGAVADVVTDDSAVAAAVPGPGPACFAPTAAAGAAVATAPGAVAAAYDVVVTEAGPA